MTDSAAPAAMLRIDGELSIYRAAELKTALLAPLQQGTTLDVDLSGVTELDTAGVQLLMLAKNTAQQQGGNLRLSGHSAAVVDVFELLGLAGWFGDPLVISPSSATR
jgi:anti-anti-sigma factor